MDGWQAHAEQVGPQASSVLPLKWKREACFCWELRVPTLCIMRLIFAAFFHIVAWMKCWLNLNFPLVVCDEEAREVLPTMCHVHLEEGLPP